MTPFRKVMSYLGLVDDDEYDDYEPYDEPQPASRAVAAGPGQRGAMGVDASEPAAVGMRPYGQTVEQPSAIGVPSRSSVVRPIVPVQSTKPATVSPTSFDDCKEIGDRFKAGVPVIVNLQAVERDIMRRIVDFMSGLTYGLGGDMERTADRVFLITPTSGAPRS